MLSLLKVFINSSYQRGCHGKADGKKKVIGKERRSKEKVEGERMTLEPKPEFEYIPARMIS
jgi:hypothetical protein